MPDRSDGVKRKPLGGAIAGLVLFIAGLLVGAGALDADRKDRQLRRDALSAEGTVVAQIKQQTPDGDAFAPLIAFTTAAGERVSFTAKPVDPSVYWLGAKVRVLYPPGNPAAAAIDKTTSRRIRNLLAGGTALLLMALGGYVSWYAQRIDAREQQA